MLPNLVGKSDASRESQCLFVYILIQPQSLFQGFPKTGTLAAATIAKLIEQNMKSRDRPVIPIVSNAIFRKLVL